MAQASAHDQGKMDIQDQKDTFHGFLLTTVWMCTLIAQWVALLTLGFAIGAGFWAGFAAYVVIGIAAGMLFRLSGVYWAVQIASWVLLVLGGLIVPALAGMAG
jgi:Bacterial aa3 type cytochrome c oxidase subunit IV